MQGLERFVELCIKTWPDERLGFSIYPGLTGEYRLQVTVSRWLAPGDFGESDLKQPQAMIRTLKMTMDGWTPALEPLMNLDHENPAYFNRLRECIRNERKISCRIDASFGK